MLSVLILLTVFFTRTQQNHTISGCGAAPGPVDPIVCLQKSLVSNCKVDADCPGEHDKCCLRECNVFQCRDLSNLPGGPGDVGPGPACPHINCDTAKCEFGFEVDRNGCETCLCKNSPCPQYGPNPPGVCTRPGDPIFIRGIKCDGPPVTIPCEPACPTVSCDNINCQFGFQNDRNGCKTCLCENSPCPQYGPPGPGVCTRPGDPIIVRGVTCNGPPVEIPCKPVQKPDKCPFVNLPALSCPGGPLPRKCSNDRGCPGYKKCCRSGCEFRCRNPASPDNKDECPYVNIAAVSCPVQKLRSDKCSGDGSCLGEQKCCNNGCYKECTDPGNPCPPEPRCPRSRGGPGPGRCPAKCIYEYITTVNGAKCKIKCTRSFGPRGQRGQRCPPTNCPRIGPVEPIGRPIGPPAPAPAPPPAKCPPVCAIFCNFGNVLDENNCPTCKCKTAPVDKPGECPYVNLAAISCPANSFTTRCSNDKSCPGNQKCCHQGCSIDCTDPGNPCPPEPRCPLQGAGPPGRPGVRHCESQCIYEYITTVNGARCKIRCTLANGPPGPPGKPCPPTNCPRHRPIGPPSPAPAPPPVDKPGECPYVNLAAISCPANSFPSKCLNDKSCPGNQKCCNQGCLIDCTNPGNPCPPEPVCPSSPVGPGDCEPKCIFEYVTSTNGVRCKVACTRGPLGPRPGPDHPCPPAECPLIGQGDDQEETAPPPPVPIQPPPLCANCCGPPPCCSFCLDCNIGNPLPNNFCGTTDRKCPQGYYCKTNPQIGKLGVCCKGTRPQKCPVDHFKYMKCYGKFIRLCKSDDNCSPNKKCCKQGCFQYCIDPVLYEWYKW
ncbi:cysteine-rich motor neuron 1 protein-like isoform X2 [Mytilus edulis]|uniref:cysteine-rich motor neuron 1 protein-like isoform X2 n=1 Tax=Mytilus edulis TaxID=6550 RepID=UPI0039F11FB3